MQLMENDHRETIRAQRDAAVIRTTGASPSAARCAVPARRVQAVREAVLPLYSRQRQQHYATRSGAADAPVPEWASPRCPSAALAVFSEENAAV